MKFVRVSKIATELNMDVSVVFEMVQKKLFEKGVYWSGDEYANTVTYASSHQHYNKDCGGLVIIIDNELTYGSEDYCLGRYTKYFYADNFLQIKVKDFDIIYNNTVKLSGEYTKEQLQQILNNMEE